MRVISVLVAMVVICIGGIWVQKSTSELDPESIMGESGFLIREREIRLKIPPAMEMTVRLLMPNGSMERVVRE